MWPTRWLTETSAVWFYPRDAWDIDYGAAGTVGAVGDVLAASGWPASCVSRDGLDWLLDKLLSAQSADRLRLAGLKDDRRALIGGGLSIFRAVFNLLQIDQMQLATGSLRHGLLFDLMGSTLTASPASSSSDQVQAVFLVQYFNRQNNDVDLGG